MGKQIKSLVERMDRDNFILGCIPNCIDKLPTALIKGKKIQLQRWSTMKNILLLLDDPDINTSSVPFVSNLFKMNNPNKKGIAADEIKLYEKYRKQLIDIFGKEY